MCLERAATYYLMYTNLPLPFGLFIPRKLKIKGKDADADAMWLPFLLRKLSRLWIIKVSDLLRDLTSVLKLKAQSPNVCTLVDLNKPMICD